MVKLDIELVTESAKVRFKTEGEVNMEFKLCAEALVSNIQVRIYIY